MRFLCSASWIFWKTHNIKTFNRFTSFYFYVLYEEAFYIIRQTLKFKAMIKNFLKSQILASKFFRVKIEISDVEN